MEKNIPWPLENKGFVSISKGYNPESSRLNKIEWIKSF